MCWVKKSRVIEKSIHSSSIKTKKIIRNKMSIQHKPAGFSPKDGAVMAGNLMLVPLPCWLLSSLNGPCAKPPPPAPITKGRYPSSREPFNLKTFEKYYYAFEIPTYFVMFYSNMEVTKNGIYFSLWYETSI